TLIMVGAIVGIEIVGRRMTSDWYDVMVASLLAVILFVIGYRHYYNPLPWLKPVIDLGQLAWENLKRWAVEVGYDLRGNPPVRRGFPAMMLGILSVLFAWAALLIGFGDDFPQVIRALGASYFYIGYLLLMSVVWAALCGGIALSMWFCVGLLHDDLSSGEDGLFRGPSRGGLLLGLVAVLLVGGRIFSLWQVLAACLVIWAVLAAVVLTTREIGVQYLWRPRGGVRVRSVSAGQSAILMYLFGTLLAIDLVLTA